MNIRQSSKSIDVIILSVLIILITLHPYYIHGDINLFEVGLYLPGINAILGGLVPFRDFFHLRGPLELYIPAALMALLKPHIAVLYTYFYVGNVLCLIGCLLIARELLKTRYLLYLFVFPLIARTFPRVVFAYWGGIRYAFGLFAVWCALRYFRTQRLNWIFWAGILTMLGWWTSLEIGVYAGLGIGGALLAAYIFKVGEAKSALKAMGGYLAVVLLIAVPGVVYLLATGSGGAYVETILSVALRMHNLDVIDPHLISIYPRNFEEALQAMLNPFHTNFKHMTPSFLYIILLVYLIRKLRTKAIKTDEIGLICLGVYGFIMYNTAFRGIWAAQFEMALMPEKILLFYLLEVLFLYLLSKKEEIVRSLKNLTAPEGIFVKRRLKAYGINFLFIGLLGSSLGYSWARFDHRFYAFKYIRHVLTGKDVADLRPLAQIDSRPLTIERAKGVEVSTQQAEEIETITRFIRQNSDPGDVVFTYPEIGILNFFADRPFVGRFPLATFSWFNDPWHKELLADLNESNPKIVIVQKELPPGWETAYLTRGSNRQKYNDVLSFVEARYALKTEVGKYQIFVRK